MVVRKSFAVACVSTILLVLLVVFVGCSGDKNKDNANVENGTITGAINVVSREDGSGTRDAFVELMGIVDENENDATTQNAEITNSTSVMMSTVQGNEKAIGYVSLGSLSDSVKAVELDGIAPSTQTVKDGTYKLQRPFKIAYVDGGLSDVAADFVKFIMSVDGQQIINDEGYISIDASSSYSSRGLKGKVTLAGSTSVAPVMNVLADKYKQLNPEVTVEIQESGSSAGIESAIQGAVEIAMSSRELKDEEAQTLKSETIALDGIAVIVNQSNSITNLSSEQIKSIFKGETVNWDDVKSE